MLSTLCDVITEDLLGSMASKIVHVLSLLGRLTAAEISRHLKVHISAVLRSLVSLVQMQAVLFWTDEASNKTFYSANWNGIYNFLRAGWIQTTHNSAFSTITMPHASKILQNLTVLGHLRIVDLANMSECTEADIGEMLKHGFLKQVLPYDFWPSVDLKTHLWRHQLDKLVADPAGLALSEAQKKVQVQNAVDAEMNKITQRDRTDALPPHTVVCINNDRYLAAGRRDALVQFAASRIGTTTAKVYEQALICSEHNIQNLKAKRIPTLENNASTNQIAQRLTNVDLTAGFVKPEVKEEGENSEQPNKRQKLSNFAANGIFTLNQGELVNKHMQMLEESPIRFVRRAGDRGGGEWFISFDQVIEDLKRVTFDNIIKDKFGPTCARLLRVVRDQVKVDEKYLGQVALVQQKDIRFEMTKLQLFGFVDLQEVPRGNDRAPGRNFYFWYHKPEKAYSRIVDELYGSMQKTYQKLKELRKFHETLLAKLNRQDVQSDLEKYLTGPEKAELKKFHDKERELVSELMLIDSQVRIFRDY